MTRPSPLAILIALVIVAIIYLACRKGGRKVALTALIGPNQEQEIPKMPNPSRVLKDTQKFTVGPFKAVDAKGAVIGPATGVTPSVGDTAVLSGTDNGDGTLTFAAGMPGTTQAVCADPSGAKFVIEVEVTPGAEAGLSAEISDPVDQ